VKGKEECVETNVLVRSYKYLIDVPGRKYETVLSASLILMSCTIA
jgi:hypothetical protein